MKLVVGLGNPGKMYEMTRHNVGFIMVDKYRTINNLGDYRIKYNGEYIESFIRGEKVIFLRPLSYMNLSGEVIKKYVDYFDIDINDVLIVHDDKDISLGNVKLKTSGSSGGHNGLLNIENKICTRNYKRIKVGISNNTNIELKDFVLGKFTLEEQKTLAEVSDMVIDSINLFIIGDFESAMQKYNKKESKL